MNVYPYYEFPLDKIDWTYHQIHINNTYPLYLYAISIYPWKMQDIIYPHYVHSSTQNYLVEVRIWTACGKWSFLDYLCFNIQTFKIDWIFLRNEIRIIFYFSYFDIQPNPQQHVIYISTSFIVSCESTYHRPSVHKYV